MSLINQRVATALRGNYLNKLGHLLTRNLNSNRQTDALATLILSLIVPAQRKGLEISLHSEARQLAEYGRNRDGSDQQREF